MQSRRVAVRGIILKEDRLLCVRLKKYNDPTATDNNEYWCLPGGGVDIGEPLVTALERELIEEVGVKPVVGNLLYVQQYQDVDQEQMEFFFHVTNADDYENISLENTTHGAIEIAELAFIDPAANFVLPQFLTKENLVATAAEGTTKFFSYIKN